MVDDLERIYRFNAHRMQIAVLISVSAQCYGPMNRKIDNKGVRKPKRSRRATLIGQSGIV